MTNKEKFLKLVSNEKTDTLKNIRERIQNRAQLRESKTIAYKVLDRLDQLKWSQKDLAEKMAVTPQQVNKIVRGQENLTISTQVKLQEILDIPILASYYEKNAESFVSVLQTALKENYKSPVRATLDADYIQSSNKLSVSFHYKHEQLLTGNNSTLC